MVYYHHALNANIQGIKLLDRQLHKKKMMLTKSCQSYGDVALVIAS
jgi:hypothetical protein